MKWPLGVCLDVLAKERNCLIFMMIVMMHHSVGWVLSHIMDGGSQHSVGFVFRTLNVAKTNCSQLDKEGAAVIFGLKRFHIYLFGRWFTIVTDHKPLLTLFGEDKQVPGIASPNIQKWALILRAYEYSIEYRQRKQQMNADCCSRLLLPTTESADPEERNLMTEELENFSVLPAKKLAKWTRRDPILAHVHAYLLHG